MMGLFQDLVAIQREIYLAFAGRIGDFAKTGDWTLLGAYLPMGILFGAVHALTPGHSKAVLATYLAGSTASVPRGLAVSFVLSFVHVGMSVLIALLSLPLVSVALGSVGRAPLLEDLSRGFLGVIGLWLLWQGVRGTGHGHGQGMAAGLAAGLTPGRAQRRELGVLLGASCPSPLLRTGPIQSAPIATEALQRIAELYKIESELRGRPAEERRAARQQRSRPIIDAL